MDQLASTLASIIKVRPAGRSTRAASRDEIMRNGAWALATAATEVGLSEQTGQVIRLLTERALYQVAKLGEDLAVLALMTEARFRRLDAHIQTCTRCRPRGVHKLRPCPTLVGLRREVTEMERAVEAGRRFLAGVP